jgi:prevent-host-death family protein
MAMANYSVAQAKDKLPQLINRALAGEEVVITRRGAVVAELKPKLTARKKLDDAFWEELRQVRESQPAATISAVDLIRQVRDEGY